jgi:hypothetical protein
MTKATIVNFFYQSYQVLLTDVVIKIKFGCGGHLGRCSEMLDTILEEDHPRIISAKLVEIGSVVSEKIFLISSPLFF